MSDDFIPLNQSTPVNKKWHHTGNQNNPSHNHSGYQNNFNNQQNYRRHRGGGGRGFNRWSNNSRNSSFGSDSNNSYENKRVSIDAYLHPSMLEDPWAKLREKMKDECDT